MCWRKAQILDPFMGSKYLTTNFIAFVVYLFSLYFLVHRIRRRSPAFGTRFCTFEYTTCWHKWHQCRRVRTGSSPSTFWNEERVGADEVGRFFETEPTDAASKPSYFYCRICRKDVSVLTHGPHEVLRHFQGVKHFARDQRLRLETPGWRVLDFEGNPLSESGLDAPKAIHSSRSSSYSRSVVSFCWGSDCGWFWGPGCHVISPCQGVVTGWSVAIGRILRDGSPTVVAIFITSQSSEHRRNMVSGRCVGWYFPFNVSTYPCSLVYWWCVLVDHFERDVSPHPFPRVWLGKGAWALQHWIWGVQIRNLDDYADTGKAHISTCLCGGVEPIQLQYYREGYLFVKSSWCCWSRYIRCVCAWGSACSGRGFCKLSRKWVPCEGPGIPYFWPPAKVPNQGTKSENYFNLVI